MSWNDPGGNGQNNDGDGKKSGNRNNDPWGSNNNQGPPDLDEVFKNLSDKLNQLFGGKGGGSNKGGNGKPLGSLPFVVFVVIAAIVWAVFGFYQVDQQERAVVLRLGVCHDTRSAGLQWNPPLIDHVEIINVTKVRTVRHQATMLTEDENIVDVTVSVQYTVNDPGKFLLEVRDPEVSLQHALESALRHVVGGSKMDLVITEGREQLAVEVRSRLQGYLDVYSTGIFVSQVNIDDSQPPSQVQEAFNDVTRAKEDKEKFKNEAEAYANAIIPEARGQAQRQLEEAQAYRDQVIAAAEGEAQRFEKLLAEYKKAPEVTRQRLYLDTVQQVYAGSTKVMVDVEGGNNMLYLPLDKIAGQQSMPSRSSVTGLTNGQAVSLDEQDLEDITRRVVERLRREMQTNSRRREGR